MQNSAKQVEGMVRMKMEQKEYIILCLEDTNDWSNATTRRLVMQVCTSLVVSAASTHALYLPACFPCMQYRGLSDSVKV